MTAICEDTALASQCLDLCQMLASKSLSFSFSLKVGNNFSFSMESRGEGALSPQKKKKKTTPSALRRNARRREEFLRKKLASSAKESHQGISEEEAETADLENIFKCDQCRNTFKSENGLKIHVGKSHKKVTQVHATPDQLAATWGSNGHLHHPPLGCQQGGALPQQRWLWKKDLHLLEFELLWLLSRWFLWMSPKNTITSFCDCEDFNPTNVDCNKQPKIQ